MKHSSMFTRLLYGSLKSSQEFTILFKGSIVLSVVGFVGILTGLFIILVNPYEQLFQWKSKLGDGGEMYELWKDPPVELYLRVFLWNVTNQEAFMNGTDTKLKVEEVGPYVYRELMAHSNVTFNPNGTMTANPKHPLIWVPELSEGHKEDDLLILPNIALLSIADVVSDESYFTKFGLNMLIRRTNSQPLVLMTAREFMFGYSSTLMTLGNKFMPSWIYFDKLGLIDRMYDFEGDIETVHTGEKDYRIAGLLDTYNRDKKIPQWERPCGDVEFASDGTKFPGDIKPDDKLLFFRKSMCRSKYLVKVNETVSSGFDAFVYNFESNSDDNGKINKNNSCYCKKKGKCLPPGLLDVRGCYYGFPIALSNPHFLDADPIALKQIESGMKPARENHLSYFVIQPTSGLPLEISARFQINMALGSIKTINNVEKFDNMILPLLWAEMKLYKLPPSLNLKFKIYLVALPILTNCLLYFSLICGSALLIYAMHKFIKAKNVEPVFNSPWVEDDYVLNMERKLSVYIPEKRASMSAKELEVYISSLVRPLNQEISFQEFVEMKEEDV